MLQGPSSRCREARGNRRSGRAFVRRDVAAETTRRIVLCEVSVGTGAVEPQVLCAAWAWWRDVRLMTWCLFRRAGTRPASSDREGAYRVRLVGPGRFVGHVGVLDGGPGPVVARTRERAVLIRLPAGRVREMLREPSAVARRFSAALAEDVARARSRPTGRWHRRWRSPARTDIRPTPSPSACDEPLPPDRDQMSQHAARKICCPVDLFGPGPQLAASGLALPGGSIGGTMSS